MKALIFPAEWFDALYSKTGVTGPYMALFGVSTFLASKVLSLCWLYRSKYYPSIYLLLSWFPVLKIDSIQEYFVMEHDFYVGMGLAIVMTYLIKTQGPAYTEA